MTSSGKTAQPIPSDTSVIKKRVKLLYSMEEDDSEQFPVEVRLGCFEDLIGSLSVLLGLKKEKQLSIVLDRSEAIINLEKLCDDAEYRVEKKVKEKHIRIYLTRSN